MENEENILNPQPEACDEALPKQDCISPAPLAEELPEDEVLSVMEEIPVEDAEYPDIPIAEYFPPVEQPRKKRSGKKVWKTILLVLLVIGLIAGSCGITAVLVNNRVIGQTNQAFISLYQQIDDLKEEIQSNSFTGNGNSISGTGTSDGLTPGQIYAQNKDCVVAISNQVTTNIFGQVAQTASSGSGFIISANGYIITNYHVVEGASKLTVTISDGKEYNATLVGYEENSDLALLKIDATDLSVAKIGSSNDLIVGDQVVAIGNPLGKLTNSLTVGYISAKDRSVTTEGTVINMLQTDAAINPGNSGGPLFNMRGEIVGITTAKYSGTTTSGASIEGIGFAIPMDDVVEMIEELARKGFVSAPYMGITVNSQADGFGVLVRSVELDGPAAVAGILPGDLIVGLGKFDIKSRQDLDKVLQEFEAFETTTVFVFRDQKVLELSITFAEKNQSASSTSTN